MLITTTEHTITFLQFWVTATRADTPNIFRILVVEIGDILRVAGIAASLCIIAGLLAYADRYAE